MNELPEGVLVDDEDIERVLERRWHVASSGYVLSCVSKAEIQSISYIRLHRFILKISDKNILIDHINRNKLDNRKSNLRLCDRSTNAINRTAQSNSKSGIKGICWDKNRKRWRATATRNKKQYHLGFYKSIEEAIIGYNNRIEEIHGEWAVKI